MSRRLNAYLRSGSLTSRSMALCGFVMLSGCVANSTLPAQDVGVLLDTSVESQTDPAPQLDSKSAESSSGKPTPPEKVATQTAEADLSPAVKNAIVPTARETPAQQATEKLANAKKTDLKPPAKVETAEQTATPVAKPKPATNEKPEAKTVDPETEVTETKPKKPKKQTLFGALLGANEKTRAKPKPQQVAKASTTTRRQTKVTLRKGQKGSLPGVRLKKVWGIETDDSEERDEPVRVAAVTNLARRGTHGLLLQRKDVKVGCFPRGLVRILKRVEKRFGRTPIVTSGYRSRAYNRRIRGAKRSMHIQCKAADIQVRGVSKWRLAKYMRTLPGRGGVGTYCHTASVHIDIGQKRDWNRRCRRKRRK